MNRRQFFGLGAAALAIGAFSMIGGCSKAEGYLSPKRMGNQEKLWSLTEATARVDEPVELASAKNTLAVYRDASFAKGDPDFKPQTGGG
jgi:hypothetical protein